MIDHVLQLTLAGLLMLTVVWCVLVHHKLRRMQAPESETAAFVEALTFATNRASLVISEIKETVDAAELAMIEREKELQQKLDQIECLSRSINVSRDAVQKHDDSKRRRHTESALSAGKTRSHDELHDRKKGSSDSRSTRIDSTVLPGKKNLRQKLEEEIAEDCEEFEETAESRQSAAKLMQALQGLR